jgi:collagen type I/II/III/V/XI/XXIV/XXVII alpha
MKNKITQSIALVTLLFFTQLGYSQAPKKMSYQAVVRDATNVLVANTDVGIRISVYSINPNSTPGNIHFIYYFKERHITTTNQNGLFSIVVGAGTLLSGNFNNINWGANEYYISSEIDITGGTNYTISGGQQLMSVPYAFYANQTGGGKVLLNGITNPLITQGTTGDFYINTVTNILFGPKTAVWPSTGVSLVGPQGATGLTGAVGPQGIQGLTGAQGIAGVNGATGASGKNTLVKTTTEVAGANCATGGTKVEVGLDANSNSVLDTSEVNATLTKYICNGAVGAQGQQGLTGAQGAQGLQGLTGPAGTNGINGAVGPQGPIGLTGSTGAQGAQGIAGPQGEQGVTGTTGVAGKNTLVKTTSETAGINCVTGGTKVEVGLDVNSNGVLDTSEVNVTLTKYVCNGVAGATGAQGLAGSNGAIGPQGAIGPAGTQGLQGVAGTNGTNGVDGKNTLLNTTVEPAGVNCTNGGTKIEVGLDANANGVLESSEVNITLTKYVCNGSTSQNTVNGGSSFSNLMNYSTPGTFVWTVPTGVTRVIVECWGGGAAGTYYMSSVGGSSGGYGKGIYNVTPGDNISIIVGSGGVPYVNYHVGGGSSSFGTLISSSGGTTAGAGGSQPGNSNGNILSLKGGFNTGANGGNAPLGGFGGVGNSAINSPGNSPGGGGGNTYIDGWNYLNGPGGDGRVIIWF